MMIRPNPTKACLRNAGVLDKSPPQELPPLIPSWSSPERVRTTSDLRPRGLAYPLQLIDSVNETQQSGAPRSGSPWTVDGNDPPCLQSARQRNHSAFSPFPFHQEDHNRSTYYHTPSRPVQSRLSGFVPIKNEDEPKHFYTPSHGSDHINSSFATPKGKASPAVTVDTAPLTISSSTEVGSYHAGRFTPNCRSSTPSSIHLRSPTPSSSIYSPLTVSFQGLPHTPLRSAAAQTPSSSSSQRQNACRTPTSFCSPKTCHASSPTERPVLSTVPTAAAATTTTNIHRVSNNARVLKARPKSAPTVGTTTRVPSDEEVSRKIRIKTEMCMHFANGKQCPFGDNCTYAHGEEELQMTKLVDLHDAGLVDMETYRIKPCWTWVATGSCPFGKRCTGIHDARCVGTEASSWLPHTETQGNTIATDINVESLHQKRQNAIIYNNPFGAQFHMKSSTFADLYRQVTGMDAQRQKWQLPQSKQRKVVHPIYKLQIALILRGENSDWQYKYRPQHIVHDDLCMVLQKRAFRVQTNDQTNRNRLPCSSATAVSSAVEIQLKSYSPKNPTDILVHELAFGPDADPTVRGVALWFNIAEDDVTTCTPQQAKRFRWKRQGPHAKKHAVEKVSVFDSGILENTPMIRPHDGPAFRLVTGLMEHRLRCLRCDLLCDLKDRFDRIQAMDRARVQLQNEFIRQRRNWMAWAWPADAKRECVDASTPVPPVEGPYHLNDSKSHAFRLWSGFVANAESWGTPSKKLGPTFGRLLIFAHLRKGYSVDPSISEFLPHIQKDRAFPAAEAGTNQDRCWKALLLQSEDEDNEWAMVRNHFEKSRSKKVLSILQQ